MILVAVAQLARASPCEGECCGFKSRQSPISYYSHSELTLYSGIMVYYHAKSTSGRPC